MHIQGLFLEASLESVLMFFCDSLDCGYKMNLEVTEGKGFLVDIFTKTLSVHSYLHLCSTGCVVRVHQLAGSR